MCVVSMIMDHYTDRWTRPSKWTYNVPYQTTPVMTPIISQDEIDEFRKLLDRAREYDKKHGEPDNCELDSKRQKLKDLAGTLGIDISFV